MPHKVLLVACWDPAREPLYALTEILKSNGYSCENTHADTEGDSEIKIDRVLDAGVSLSDYISVVFFDDGGDEKASIKLAKKALESEVPLGGFSLSGCGILFKAGAFKDAYVCDGLPKEFYKGVKSRVGSPSVRSDKIVTGNGEYIDGFGVVLVDALGGKVKRIVHSQEMEEYIQATQPPVPEDAEITKVSLRRGDDGWSVIGAKPSEACDAALKVAVVAQSMCDDPSDISEAVVSVAFGDEGPSVQSVETDEAQQHARRKALARMAIQLERELANEGIFLQPGGKIYIKGHPRGRLLSPEEALIRLREQALESLEDELREEKEGRVDPWTSLCSRRHRHIMRCLAALLSHTGMSPSVKVAATSIGGPNFGVAITDMDMRARVWPYKDEEGWLKDKQKYIEDLPRYNPEYVSQMDKDPNAYGVYYVWEEPRRDVYL